VVKKILTKVFGDQQSKDLKRLNKRVAEINALEDNYKGKSLEELKALISDYRKKVQDGKVKIDDILPEVFAIVRETSVQTLGMRPFDVQLVGGMALHEGNVAEMRTGEGKTLVATLPLVLNALEGKGAHLVTVNDFLVQRDAGWMANIYDALGFSVGVILANETYIYDRDYLNEDHEDERFQHLKLVDERKEGYAADITYGTNNEFGFDYLRDNMVREVSQLRQRPLHYAIVDEVDSILIDEARTPLIISASASESDSSYSKFASLVKKLKEDDYEVDEKRRAAVLTDEGVVKVQDMLGIDNLYGSDSVSHIYHLEQSLRAETLFKRDKDYVVNEEGEVIIVDEFTGRLMHGRRYNEGLHQAIEAKEGVNVQQESMTLATISFQNYFRLYEKLSGMTGTAETEQEEFYQIYELGVIVIPTNMPIMRDDKTDLIFKTQQGKFKAIVNRVKELQESGQPVLIGTASIEKNEILSMLLSKAGVDHSVLNAKNNEGEAAVVAKAGQPGAVTLATNIAGRGTDIVLGEGVVDKGGLFVLGSERHESRRIDNQLRGRAGRQGDPGMTQFFVAADDDLMRIFGGERIAGLMNRMGVDEETPIENKALGKALESAQKKVESHNFDQRKRVVQYDDVMNRHRKAIYGLRREILTNEDITDVVDKAVAEVAGSYRLVPGEKPEKLAKEIDSMFHLGDTNLGKLKNADEENFSKIVEEGIAKRLETQKKVLGDVGYKIASRELYLQVLDSLWMQHLENMNHLREGIGWRSVGQKDPLVEYRREGQRIFENLEFTMGQEAIRGILHAQPPKEDQDLVEEAVIETELTRAAKRSIAAGSQVAEAKKDKTVKITRRVDQRAKREDGKRKARGKKKQQRKNRKKNRR